MTTAALGLAAGTTVTVAQPGRPTVRLYLLQDARLTPSGTRVTLYGRKVRRDGIHLTRTAARVVLPEHVTTA